jgi:C4-dicarboxylate-binding protein DctP
MSKNIRWIIAHEPIHLFLRTAEAFKTIIEQTTSQEINVEILTLSDYIEKYSPETKKFLEKPEKERSHTWHLRLLDGLKMGAFEITQTQVNHFRHLNKEFELFDLPFLFKDHDHCTRVVEGPIGQSMANSLVEHGMRGLAFTYSGGWRVIGSNTEFKSLEDLKNKRVRTNLNPINEWTMEAIGAEPKPSWRFFEYGPSYGHDAVNSGELDATETTYIRFKGTNVLKTNHSMFITQVVVGNKFWDTLSDELQAKMREAILEVSRLERKWSIEDAEEFERNCKLKGVQIHEITQAEIDMMKTQVSSVYERYNNDPYIKDFIENIKLH